MTTKRCFVCGETKPIDQFYTRAGGRLVRGRCKACEKVGRTATTKVMTCATCGRQFEAHAKAKWNTGCPECRRIKEDTYKRPSVTIKNMCAHCGYLTECRTNIWDMNFDPPCFHHEAIAIPVQVEAQYL